jgi:hypothetical protein
MTNAVANVIRTNALLAHAAVTVASNSATVSPVPGRTEQKSIAEQKAIPATKVTAKVEPAVAVKVVENSVKASKPAAAPDDGASQISRQKITFVAAGGGGAMCLLLGITLFSRKNKSKRGPSLISKSLGR